MAAKRMTELQLRLEELVPGRYTLTGQIGAGAHSVTWRAKQEVKRGRVAARAVKKVYSTPLREQKYAMHTLREIKLLAHFQHPCIVRLEDVIADQSEPGQNHDLFIVMSLADMDLLTTLQANTLSVAHVKAFTYQILVGLLQIHAAQVVHRDLKPENILVTKGCRAMIADFGLARDCAPGAMTRYVTTIWYRAPEMLLGSAHYTEAVDMWSMGAIMAEMFTKKALFEPSPGQHQVDRLLEVVGRPDDATIAACEEVGIETDWKNAKRIDFVACFPSAGPDGRDLMDQMIQFSPQSRPTAKEALQHAFLRGIPGRDAQMEDVSEVRPFSNSYEDDLQTVADVRQEIINTARKFSSRSQPAAQAAAPAAAAPAPAAAAAEADAAPRTEHR
eukprot:TRINITY_DN5592_c0_g1_i8.p1 TRINITY_DN5592_c0_g1~~TRINITY_DN5592_c0_g1_i8.p1  ORF type:complete len:407 (+),score=104.17 TRINITY_DN5592_c0_g1_i8:60-1223(+)